MPHPRNLMKLTGDIHPPEVEFDLDELAEEEASPAAAGRRMEAPRAERRPLPMALSASGPAQSTFEDARAQVRRNPLATLGAAFALGFLLMKLFR